MSDEKFPGKVWYANRKGPNQTTYELLIAELEQALKDIQRKLEARHGEDGVVAQSEIVEEMELWQKALSLFNTFHAQAFFNIGSGFAAWHGEVLDTVDEKLKPRLSPEGAALVDMIRDVIRRETGLEISLDGSVVEEVLDAAIYVIWELRSEAKGVEIEEWVPQFWVNQTQDLYKRVMPGCLGTTMLVQPEVQKAVLETFGLRAREPKDVLEELDSLREEFSSAIDQMKEQFRNRN